MKRILPLPLLLLLVACSVSIGVAVASIGIAGAAFETYCDTSANNCTPQEVSLGVAVVAESVNEETVLLSGATTATVVAQSVANLTALLVQAKALPQTPEVAGIINAIQVAIPLIQSLVAAATTPAVREPSGLIVRTVTVIPIKLTAKDRAKLAEMDAKIAALKH
jgi:hypothetical protein